MDNNYGDEGRIIECSIIRKKVKNACKVPFLLKEFSEIYNNIQGHDMNLEDQTIEIKQEAEKPDKIDGIVNTAHIKLEKANPNYGVQCDRIKDECSTEHEDGASLSTDAVEQTKMEVLQAVGVKVEKLEEKTFVAGTKYENMDTSELNEQLGIKCESDRGTMFDSATDIIKNEPIEEQGCDADLSINAVKQTKMEDLPVVELKHEKQEEKPWMGSAKYENMKTLGLNEEFYIKSESDSNTLSDSTLASEAKKKTWVKQAAHADRGRKLFACYVCKYTARCKRALIVHLKSGNCTVRRQHPPNKYVCIYCNRVFSRNIDLSTHMLIHTGKFSECIHCGASFKRAVLLEHHISRKHPNFAASVFSKIHECTHCSYKTTLFQSLTKHMRTHKLITCTICNVSFKSKLSLDDHTLKKHPSFTASVSCKIHECTHCAFKTTFADKLDTHIMMSHTSTFIICTFCDASFKSKQSLDDHILKKHPSFTSSVSCKVHECTHCSYKTTFTSRLDAHMISHTSKFFMCTVCDASFKSKLSLYDHILKKHPSFTASVSCEVHECKHCSYKTTSTSRLDAHMRSHTPKFIMCTVCDKSFKSKLALDDHTLKKHPTFITSVSHKIHACTHCSYKTTLTTDLAKHMMTHTGNLFMCTVCDASFKSKRSLDDHILKKHPSQDLILPFSRYGKTYSRRPLH